MVLAAFTLTPYANAYSLYFVGIAEISSIPLTIIDIIKCMNLNYPRLMLASQVTFAALFMVFRVAAWTFVSLLYWYDTISRYPEVPNFGVLFCVGDMVDWPAILLGKFDCEKNKIQIKIWSHLLLVSEPGMPMVFATNVVYMRCLASSLYQRPGHTSSCCA